MTRYQRQLQGLAARYVLALRLGGKHWQFRTTSGQLVTIASQSPRVRSTQLQLTEVQIRRALRRAI
jgi:hypothetical protein